MSKDDSPMSTRCPRKVRRRSWCVRVRFPRSDGQLRVQEPQGAGPGDRRSDFGDEERTGMDDRLPSGVARDLRIPAHAQLGRRHVRPRFPGHLLLHEGGEGAGDVSWDDVPEDIRRTYDRLGIPEAEKKYLSGVKAQYESEVVYGSLQEDLAKAGRNLHRHRFCTARSSGDCFVSTSRTIIPPGRQQVRRTEHCCLVGRFVHLRASRSEY